MAPIERSSLALSIGVAGVAVLLAVWQVLERRWRPAELPEADQKHYAAQDLRRWSVVAVMLFLAAAVYVGSRLPSRLAGRPNPLYLELWAGVLVCVVLLLALATIDWSATRRFAARHRAAMAKEGLQIFRDEMRRRAALRATESGLDPPDAE